ncbi:MAG: DUF2029 domain-containing protein [Planctomycetes bacterium]|nr:DUF2029 domain-containing protein [Planctomycetota bacterium]
MPGRLSSRSWIRGPAARGACVAWAIASLGACVWSLATMTIDRRPWAGPENLDVLLPFWIASASGWAALSVLMLTLPTAAAPAARRSVAIAVFVVGVGLLARGIVLATHEPALSDDVYRYVFDGRNAAAGVNPYLITPEEARSRKHDEHWPGQRSLAGRVNNPELHTIYLPASQWVFMAIGAAIPDAWTLPGTGALVFRVVLVGFEMLALILLLGALRSAGRSAWWAATYAWHPLPLSEIAGSGHQDVIGIALLMLAVWMVLRWPRGRMGSIAALAAAAAVKPIAVPVAAVLLRGRPWRDWLVSLGLGAAVVAAVSAPLLLAGGGAPLEHLGDTASRFSLKWAHFGSVYEPLLWTIEQLSPAWGNDPQEQVARVACLVLLGVVILLTLARVRDPWAACIAIFLAMVLLSPAAHPWYLLWALILVPLRPGAAAWVASLTLPWGYAALGDTAQWTVPPLLLVAAYLPVYAAILFDPLRRGIVSRS